MYYSDSVSLYHELIGASTYTLLPSAERTIVGLSIQQSGVASVSEVRCGANRIATNYGKDFPYNDTAFYCNNTVVLSKTGQDNASFIVTYVPRKLEVLAPTDLVELELATNSAVAFGNASYIMWFGFALLIFLVAVQVGTYIFKK